MQALKGEKQPKNNRSIPHPPNSGKARICVKNRIELLSCATKKCKEVLNTKKEAAREGRTIFRNRVQFSHLQHLVFIYNDILFTIAKGRKKVEDKR